MGDGRCAASRVARTRRQDHRDSWLWQDRSGGRAARPRFRHENMRGAPRCPAFHRGQCSLSRRSRLDRRGYRTIRLRADLDAGDPLYGRPYGSQAARSDEINGVLHQCGEGGIVDEDALYEALAERSIAGAVLDVWYCYPREPGLRPPATRPFHELPNVLMTPHVSGWTDGMLDARARLIAENIRRMAFGETPFNLVDP